MRIKFVRTILAPVGDGTAHAGEVHEIDDTLAHDLIGQGAAEVTDEPVAPKPAEKESKEEKKTGHPPKGKKKK